MRAARDDLEGAIQAALTAIRAQLAERDLSTLAKLPRLSDPAIEDSMHLLMNLTTQTYIADQDWFPLVAMKMVSLSLEHGNCSASAFGYGYLGVVVGTRVGDFEMGRQLGELSLELNKTLHDPKLLCKLYWILGGLNNHWTRHIRSDIPLLRSSIHHGLESGDYVFGSWAYYYLVVSTLLSGAHLTRTLEEAEGALAFFRKIKNQTYADLQEIIRNAVLNLQGATPDRRSLSDESLDEDACIADLRARSHGPGLGRYHVVKMMVLCIHEHYEEACLMGAESELTLRYLTAQPLLAEHFFYYSISLCGHYDQVDPQLQRRYRETIERNRTQLAVWADSCTENFAHKTLLVEAELARIDGRFEVAVELYERAINSAREHGFVHNEALAHFLAGNFSSSKRLATAATAHWQKAHDLYADWGAQSRVEDLEAAHPDLRRRERAGSGGGLESANASLDAMTLVKATSAISEELRLESLFDKMMAIMVESAGASKGYLFREEHGKLVLQTRSRADMTPNDGDGGHPPVFEEPCAVPQTRRELCTSDRRVCGALECDHRRDIWRRPIHRRSPDPVAALPPDASQGHCRRNSILRQSTAPGGVHAGARRNGRDAGNASCRVPRERQTLRRAQRAQRGARSTRRAPNGGAVPKECRHQRDVGQFRPRHLHHPA